MTLSIALVLIFILYLVDKNQIWRPAAKVVTGLAVLGVLVVAGFFAWTKYEDRRVVKAARQAHEKLVDACVARYSTSGLKEATVPVPQGATLDVRETCEGSPDYDWSQWKVVSQTPPETLPPDFFNHVPKQSSFDPNKPYSSVIEIHGGETLKIVHPSRKSPAEFDMNKSVPVVYLGHHQKLALVCGNFGETTPPLTTPRIEKGTAVCQ
jgi:hypothetical protein